MRLEISGLVPLAMPEEVTVAVAVCKRFNVAEKLDAPPRPTT